MKRYVIIGNGIAAARCIEGIRSTDTAGEITVVSEEEHPVYCRPLISYYLEGKTDLERILYRGRDFYDRMGCKVLYGRKATRIYKDSGKIELDDGSLLPYDAVCVATGSVPFVPRFEGIETVPECFSFMTLDDALALEKAIKPSSRVLIIGAGLIGLKCAEGICGRVADITVCDLADRVLPSLLDAECAAVLQRHLEKNGIAFLPGDSAARFEGNRAVMISGKTVDFDILVLTVGIRANISLVKEAGGEVDRGILINEYMETSIKDVYAAGDCTEGMDVSAGKIKPVATLPNASMQGYAAGVNMAGGTEAFDKAVPVNSFGFFGLPAMTAGTYEGELYEEKTDVSVRRLFVKDDLLKGFILIGVNERAGIYTSLIREKTPLSSLDFEALKKAATTTAFSPQVRRKKFGGVV